MEGRHTMKNKEIAMNEYEMAHHAISLHESISCGPNNRTCDGGKPVYVCPAHGGDNRDQDDWTANDQAAYDAYQSQWLKGVKFQ